MELSWILGAFVIAGTAGSAWAVLRSKVTKESVGILTQMNQTLIAKGQADGEDYDRKLAETRANYDRRTADLVANHETKITALREEQRTSEAQCQKEIGRLQGQIEAMKGTFLINLQESIIAIVRQGMQDHPPGPTP